MKIGIVGLGYVGLPLALEFGKIFSTIGIDISEKKINSYNNNLDPAGEIQSEDFNKSKRVLFSTDFKKLNECDFVIISVPTPVNNANIPDLGALISSTKDVAKVLKKGATVIYESTVYPGATEEVCVPLLEQISGFRWREDFFVGYSPERINPGDRAHTLKEIVKVVSGDSVATLDKIDRLYSSIITAGTYRASSIKVAEAAKAIENTQRDLNIALVNELALLFSTLKIDTGEVLDAASSKWNFLNFRPGLVGGHCIGVDPYYLTYKAETVGYHPQVILAGRKINDSMPQHIVSQAIKKLALKGGSIKGANILVLGLSFKENCSDIRNSKVVDIVRGLGDYGCNVIVHDPLVRTHESELEYGIEVTGWNEILDGNFHAIIAAVSHNEYINMPVESVVKKLHYGGLFMDVKSAYPREILIKLGVDLWRL